MIHLARGEHDAALTASELALRDRPSCPWVYALKGAVHSYSGQPARAIELARLSIRHTPLTPPLFASLLATSHYLCGQHEEAVDAARGTVEMAQDNVEAHVILAAALAASGRTQEAEPVLNDIRRLKADFSLDEFVKSQPYKNPSALDGLVADLRAAGLP